MACNCSPVTILNELPYASVKDAQKIADLISDCCSVGCFAIVPDHIEIEDFCTVGFPDGVPDSSECPLLWIMKQSSGIIYLGINPIVCTNPLEWRSPRHLPVGASLRNIPYSSAVTSTQAINTITTFAANTVVWSYDGETGNPVSSIAGNAQLIAPVKGIYIVSGRQSVSENAVSAPANHVIKLRVTSSLSINILSAGSDGINSYQIPTGQVDNRNLTATILLDVGDTVEMDIITSPTSSIDLRSDKDSRLEFALLYEVP